jgi:hypothetical protein
VTSGTIAQNMDATARNLVAMVNQDPNNHLFYMYYITGESILPGAITVTAQNLSQGQFYINSSRQTCWTPQIPASGTTYISDNQAQPGGMLVSKVNQPEAVPLEYLLPLQTGNTNTVIERILALQDALYAFTTAGIYRITGTDPTTLQSLLFDSSAFIKGINSADILNNSIYYFSTQGICSVSSGGNQIMSRNIERDLLALGAVPNFNSLVYGVSYESDRAFFLFTPSFDVDDAIVQEYRYNWITQTFTLWTRACTAAIVNKSVDKLFVADALGNIFEERKSFENTDYADEEYIVTITSTNPVNNLISLSSSANVQVGDVLQQTVAGTQYSTQVIINNTVTNVLTVQNATGFAPGSAQDYRSIVTNITYCPITCGFPEYVKKYTIWGFAFSNADFERIQCGMATDFYPGGETVPLVPIGTGGFGTQAWGIFPWGVTTIPAQLIPTWPTPNTGYAHWVVISLNLTQAFTALALDGITSTFDIVSTRGH